MQTLQPAPRSSAWSAVTLTRAANPLEPRARHPARSRLPRRGRELSWCRLSCPPLGLRIPPPVPGPAPFLWARLPRPLDPDPAPWSLWDPPMGTPSTVFSGFHLPSPLPARSGLPPFGKKGRDGDINHENKHLVCVSLPPELPAPRTPADSRAVRPLSPLVPGQAGVEPEPSSTLRFSHLWARLSPGDSTSPGDRTLVRLPVLHRQTVCPHVSARSSR